MSRFDLLISPPGLKLYINAGSPDWPTHGGFCPVQGRELAFAPSARRKISRCTLFVRAGLSSFVRRLLASPSSSRISPQVFSKGGNAAKGRWRMARRLLQKAIPSETVAWKSEQTRRRLLIDADVKKQGSHMEEVRMRDGTTAEPAILTKEA
jgi:hypothetical protein